MSLHNLGIPDLPLAAFSPRAGGMRLFKKDGPDNKGMNEAAKANAHLSKEAFNWFQAEYARTAPQREASQARANEISDAQLASMKQQDAITKDYWDYQKNTFRPLEEGIVADSQTYDTAARRQAESDAAVADVNQQVAAQRSASARELARSGVSPESGKSQALVAAGDIGAAKAAAGASYQARKGVELQGYARKMDAANLGRNLASNQATSAGVALQQGNAAAGNSMQANQAAMSGAGLMQTGFNTAIQGNQSAGNLYGQAAQIKAQSGGDMFGDLLSGAGGIMSGLGAMGVTFSDENMKEGIDRVSDEEALEQIKEVDSQKTWQYKRGAGLPTDRKTGPMAQDVQEVMGDKAAPGGKVIDLVTLNGRNMAATRALAKKVDQIATEVKSLASRRGVLATA